MDALHPTTTVKPTTTAATAAASSGLSVAPIAAAAGGGIALILVVVIVIVVRRRREAGKTQPSRQRSVVAFENPSYSEPAFSQDVKKSNPLYAWTEKDQQASDEGKEYDTTIDALQNLALVGDSATEYDVAAPIAGGFALTMSSADDNEYDQAAVSELDHGYLDVGVDEEKAKLRQQHLAERDAPTADADEYLYDVAPGTEPVDDDFVGEAAQEELGFADEPEADPHDPHVDQVDEFGFDEGDAAPVQSDAEMLDATEAQQAEPDAFVPAQHPHEADEELLVDDAPAVAEPVGHSDVEDAAASMSAAAPDITPDLHEPEPLGAGDLVETDQPDFHDAEDAADGDE